MLPLNQKVLARLDQRNVAAHPWHDLEIGELPACATTFSLFVDVHHDFDDAWFMYFTSSGCA